MSNLNKQMSEIFDYPEDLIDRLERIKDEIKPSFSTTQGWVDETKEVMDFAINFIWNNQVDWEWEVEE